MMFWLNSVGFFTKVRPMGHLHNGRTCVQAWVSGGGALWLSWHKGSSCEQAATRPACFSPAPLPRSPLVAGLHGGGAEQHLVLNELQAEKAGGGKGHLEQFNWVGG